MSGAILRHAQQFAAADPAVSAWVTASAGTGKTHVLVDRILRLLLGGTPPSRILCLTFTKAAAAEMANRFSATLGRWSVLDESDLAADLRALTGETPNDEVRARARRLFAETLEAPGGLALRTIHSFCESLIGRFPLESGVAPNFSVIDERTAAELVAEARVRVFRAAQGRDGDPLRAALDRLATLTDEDRFDRLMAGLRRTRGQVSSTAMRHVLGLAPGETPEAVHAEAREGTDCAAISAAAAVLAEGRKTDKDRAEVIASWLGVSVDLDEYARAFLTAKHEMRKDLMTSALRERHPAEDQTLRREQSRVAGLIDRLRAIAIAEASEAALVVGAALDREYSALKASHAVLDYDDLIAYARRLLADPSAVSWVHYKLDGGIDHVLVDEAQDTSPDQWAVIAALTGEFFAGEGAREDVSRTVFVVGDEKQSIYSFQGADLEAFRRVHAEFGERAADAGRPWRDVGLDLSFRSTPPVLETVDAVFGQLPAADGVVEPDAPPLHHEAFRDRDAGRVEVWPLIEPVEVEDDDPWDSPLDRPSPGGADFRLAGRVAAEIRKWLDNGDILPSAGRPIEPGDIMILVQRRGPFYAHMVRALKQRDIAVAGADRMVLTEQMAVMDLLALGRFLLLPEDDLSLAEVLKSPLIGFDDEDLFALAYGRGDTSLWRTLRRRETERREFREASERLREWLRRIDYQPPYDFLTRLLGPDGGRRAMLARLGPDADDAIDEFLSLALLYEREHSPSWQGFLAWVAAAETEVRRDLEQVRDAVRVMTVHGAKGLQAEIVILPDTVRTPTGAADSGLFWADDPGGGPPVPLWVPATDMDASATKALRERANRGRMREYRRLLYVAMTRARERLYVCGWRTKKSPKEGNWYNTVTDAVEPLAADVGEGVFRIDRPQERESPPPSTRDDTPTETLPDWATRLPDTEPEPPKPLAPSRPEGDEPPVRSPVGPDAGDRFRRGRLVHRLLQSLPDISPERRSAVARAWLARPAHGLGTEAQADIAAEVLSVLENPAHRALFGPGSLAEVPIVGIVAHRAVSARIDRIVVADDAVSIVDYKTDREPPGDADAVPSVYVAQMAAYRAVVRQIYPDRPVRCMLLWTAGPALVTLEDSILDRYAP